MYKSNDAPGSSNTMTSCRRWFNAEQRVSDGSHCTTPILGTSSCQLADDSQSVVACDGAGSWKPSHMSMSSMGGW